MNFRELVAAYLGGTTVGDAVSHLIGIKESQTEGDTIPRHALLDEFISAQFEDLIKLCPEQEALPDLPLFDKAFREIIGKV